MRAVVALVSVGCASLLAAARVDVQVCRDQYVRDVATAFGMNSGAFQGIQDAIDVHYAKRRSAESFATVLAKVAEEMTWTPLYMQNSGVRAARERYEKCLQGGVGTELRPIVRRPVLESSYAAAVVPPLEKIRRVAAWPLPLTRSGGLDASMTLEALAAESLAFAEDWRKFEPLIDDVCSFV